VSKFNGQGSVAEIAPILLLWIVFEKISLHTSIGYSSFINEATEMTKTSLESSWCPLS